MKRAGLARRRLLAAMCGTARARGCAGDVIVDVGADHGHVAAWVSAIATEREPHRAGRPDVRWVIADGLRPFRRVDIAIIAGMGARTIAGILEEGVRPGAVVAHAQDDPPALRRWLASNGWRIEAEGLAPEAGRFAEVVLALPGVEPSEGLLLDFGPRLVGGDDPLLASHLTQILGYWRSIRDRTEGRAPDVHRDASRRVAFLEAHSNVVGR